MDHMAQTKEVRIGVSITDTSSIHCLASCSMCETSGNTVRKVVPQAICLCHLADYSQSTPHSLMKQSTGTSGRWLRLAVITGQLDKPD